MVRQGLERSLPLLRAAVGPSGSPSSLPEGGGCARPLEHMVGCDVPCVRAIASLESRQRVEVDASRRPERSLLPEAVEEPGVLPSNPHHGEMPLLSSCIHHTGA